MRVRKHKTGQCPHHSCYDYDIEQQAVTVIIYDQKMLIVQHLLQ